MGYLNGRALAQIGNISRQDSPDKFLHRDGVARNGLKSFLGKGVTKWELENTKKPLLKLLFHSFMERVIFFLIPAMFSKIK